MHYFPFPLAPALEASDPITARVRTILRGLMAVFANWGAMEPSLTLVFHNRVSAIHRRIERLLVRFRAGMLRPMSPRTAKAGPRAPSQQAVRMPRKFGWLLDAGKHNAAYFTNQLNDLLTTPEMVALLEAAPQAKRMLRPLCRALAVELPWTVAAPRPPRPRKPRAPRPKPEPYKIPLPRGVITWVRREKALENARKRRGGCLI